MMNKTILNVAIGSVFSFATTNAFAILPANANLQFDPGILECTLGGTPPNNCTYGVTEVNIGSYFGMDTDGGGILPTERTPIAVGTVGLNINTTQTGAGDIDQTWSFFSAAGNHTTVSNTAILSDDGNGNVTLDFSGWNVTWNNIPLIDMGGGTQDCGTTNDGICIVVTDPGPPVVTSDIGGIQDNGTGIATVVCTEAGDGVSDCSVGDSYVLDYDARVPFDDPSNFGGVSYTLHMVGTIGLQAATNTAPVAVNDNFTVDRKAAGRPYVLPVFDIVNNDTDVDGSGDIDRTTVTIQTGVSNGITSVDPVTGNVTYTPNDDYLGPDSFTYIVSDLGGPEGPSGVLQSNEATVSITVANAIPVAVDDSASIDTSSISSVDINVSSNDTDADGTIDFTTVAIVMPANNGSTSINSTTGVVTYTPVSNFIGIDTFTYTVNDNDGSVSNSATVTITVSSGSGVLDPSAYLIMKTGNVVSNTIQPPLGEGSWFSMEVQPGVPLHTPIAGFNHLQLGEILPASSSPLVPNIDQGWLFFGNVGVHQTTSPVTILTDDSAGNVTLGMIGWDVSWNAIPSIPLGSGQDNGIATLTCYTDLALLAAGTCDAGDEFVIEYRAIVPPGDPSGFGGVNYRLHMEGVISDTGSQIGGGNPNAPYDVDVITVEGANGANLTIIPGAKADAAGNTTGVGLTAAEIGVSDPLMNPINGAQCVGGCTDFIVSDVTTDYIDVVFKLNIVVPSDGTQMRKLINSRWADFDASGGDLIGSAESISGKCQGPDGVFQVGIRGGLDCIYMRIFDGGPNDPDSLKNGTVVDPGGILLAGTPNVPPGSTSGCSISSKEVKLKERADWLIVAGFMFMLLFFKNRQASD